MRAWHPGGARGVASKLNGLASCSHAEIVGRECNELSVGEEQVPLIGRISHVDAGKDGKEVEEEHH
jgi:hypothetical protein